MDLIPLLSAKSEEIIALAEVALARARLAHYDAAGAHVTRERLTALFELMLKSLEQNNGILMMYYAEKVAHERFTTGFELCEVQTAFNVLEEATWREMARSLSAEEFARAITRVSAVLGMGKDALARAYVALATKRQVARLDQQALYEGRVT